MLAGMDEIKKYLPKYSAAIVPTGLAILGIAASVMTPDSTLLGIVLYAISAACFGYVGWGLRPVLVRVRLRWPFYILPEMDPPPPEQTRPDLEITWAFAPSTNAILEVKNNGDGDTFWADATIVRSTHPAVALRSYRPRWSKGSAHPTDGASRRKIPRGERTQLSLMNVQSRGTDGEFTQCAFSSPVRRGQGFDPIPLVDDDEQCVEFEMEMDLEIGSETTVSAIRHRILVSGRGVEREYNALDLGREPEVGDDLRYWSGEVGVTLLPDEFGEPPDGTALAPNGE